MKKVLVLAVVILFVMTTAVFAGGLYGGIDFEPKAGAPVGFHFGWQSDNAWSLKVVKDDLSTWEGTWSLGGLWTPELWPNANLKAGIDLKVDWTGGALTYEGVGFEVGAVYWVWGVDATQLGLFGELTLDSSYNLVPIVGAEIKFSPPVGGTDT